MYRRRPSKQTSPALGRNGDYHGGSAPAQRLACAGGRRGMSARHLITAAIAAGALTVAAKALRHADEAHHHRAHSPRHRGHDP